MTDRAESPTSPFPSFALDSPVLEYRHTFQTAVRLVDEDCLCFVSISLLAPVYEPVKGGRERDVKEQHPSENDIHIPAAPLFCRTGLDTVTCLKTQS